jgi:glyoxylase-like metal-dependent hydrolase (beta-lactamase superfamily II)
LPRGSDPLVPLQWQPAPGCRNTLIYPFIRKVDTTSSNSFLVRTPDAVILFDPGGLPEQAAHLSSLIQAVQEEVALPLVVILTHSHVDHYVGALSAPSLFSPDTAVVAVQESGVGIVESADRRMTQAEVLGRELAPLRVDLQLLAKDRETARYSYANGATVTIVPGEAECGLSREEISFGNGPRVVAYHTPGHSPDSCCFRMGALLFTGDILLATSPGIAGISGWDQEALIRSLDGLRELLSEERIEAVCPGHGYVLTTDDALRMVNAVQKDARRLTGIAELGTERARKAAAFAEDCMEQAHELIVVMAGRLYYVSHVMEELEEPGIAGGLDALIRGDVIDDVLESFDAFDQEYHSGKYVPLNLALKGGQVVGKLQRSFDQDQLAQIIDPTLIRRAERLLGDYITMLRGFDPPSEIAMHDLRQIIEECVTGHTVRSSTDDDVLASVDDEAAFGRMLLARIGMPPLLADTKVMMDLGKGEIPALVDRERFLDLLTYLLEDLVGGEASAITVRIEREGGAAVISLMGESAAGGNEPYRFLYSLCERAGGTLDFDETEGMRRFLIRVASVV